MNTARKTTSDTLELICLMLRLLPPRISGSYQDTSDTFPVSFLQTLPSIFFNAYHLVLRLQPRRISEKSRDSDNKRVSFILCKFTFF